MSFFSRLLIYSKLTDRHVLSHVDDDTDCNTLRKLPSLRDRRGGKEGTGYTDAVSVWRDLNGLSSQLLSLN